MTSETRDGLYSSGGWNYYSDHRLEGYTRELLYGRVKPTNAVELLDACTGRKHLSSVSWTRLATIIPLWDYTRRITSGNAW